MFIKTVVELFLILIFFSEVYEYTIEQCSPQMTRYENFEKLHHFFQYNFCINKFGLLTYKVTVIHRAFHKVTVIHRFLKSLFNTIIVNFSDQREQEYKSFSEV